VIGCPDEDQYNVRWTLMSILTLSNLIDHFMGIFNTKLVMPYCS
jgi:hypothetical protein